VGEKEKRRGDYKRKERKLLEGIEIKKGEEQIQSSTKKGGEK